MLEKEMRSPRPHRIPLTKSPIPTRVFHISPGTSLPSAFRPLSTTYVLFEPLARTFRSLSSTLNALSMHFLRPFFHSNLVKPTPPLVILHTKSPPHTPKLPNPVSPIFSRRQPPIGNWQWALGHQRKRFRLSPPPCPSAATPAQYPLHFN